MPASASSSAEAPVYQTSGNIGLSGETVAIIAGAFAAVLIAGLVAWFALRRRP